MRWSRKLFPGFFKDFFSAEDISSSQSGQQLLDFRRVEPEVIESEEPAKNDEQTPMFPGF